MRTRAANIPPCRHRNRMAGAALGAAVTLVLAGCSGTGSADERATRPAGVATTPAGATLIASQDPAELALRASATYFSQATFAVVAASTDGAAAARAASIAATAGVPALLAGPDEAAAGDRVTPLDAELKRLHAAAVLTVGSVDAADFDKDLAIVPAPAEADRLGSLLGVRVTEVPPDTTAPVRQLAALRPSDVLVAPPTTPVGTGRGGGLPRTSAATRAEGAAVVTDGSPGQAAAVGTARAAGAVVVVSPGAVGSSSKAVTELTGRSSIVGLGNAFGNDASFTWQALTAATAAQLPGGGQQVFAGKRYVALYGSPVTPSLGLLGEQGPAATVARAEKMAAPYAALTTDRIVPALEIIVTVASGEAGPDGNYSTEFDARQFLPLIEAARRAGLYVVLDFQPGRADFLTQVKKYEELLRLPNVGVALDPEWRLRPGQKPLAQIGSVDVSEVNRVVDYLAGFVAEHRLPQKLLVLHQFQTRMITDRGRLDTSHPQLALLIHADGQGSQGAKQGTWTSLHADAPTGVAWGWKNFLDEDHPMLTPEQTYRVRPLPEFVSYQ